MSAFDYFDKIYCINLKRRPEKWESAIGEFNKLNIFDRVERFDAIENKDGKRGCFESHMNVIKIAKEQNLKNVLIFEDDFAVLPRYNDKKFTKSIEFLKKQHWEFFYMGGLERRIRPRPVYNRLKWKYDKEEIDEDFDYIMKAYSVGWNQSYAVNSNIFDKILSDYENGLWDKLEERWKGKPGRTDRYYQHHLIPTAYVCVPSVTSQYNMPSDLARTKTNNSLRVPK